MANTDRDGDRFLASGKDADLLQRSGALDKVHVDDFPCLDFRRRSSEGGQKLVCGEDMRRFFFKKRFDCVGLAGFVFSPQTSPSFVKRFTVGLSTWLDSFQSHCLRASR